MGSRVTELVVTLLAALGSGLASEVLDWEFGKDVPGSTVVFQKSGIIRIWNKVVEVPITIAPCMKIAYVRVQVQNPISNPAVTYKEDTNTVRIEYGLLQSSKSWYEVIAKAAPLGCAGSVDPVRSPYNPQYPAFPDSGYLDQKYKDFNQQPDNPEYRDSNPNNGWPEYSNTRYPDSSNRHQGYPDSINTNPSNRRPKNPYSTSRYPDSRNNPRDNPDSRYTGPTNRRPGYPDSRFSAYDNPQYDYPDPMYPESNPNQIKPWYPDTGNVKPRFPVPGPIPLDPYNRKPPLIVIPDTQVRNQITCTNCLQPKRFKL